MKQLRHSAPQKSLTIYHGIQTTHSKLKRYTGFRIDHFAHICYACLRSAPSKIVLRFTWRAGLSWQLALRQGKPCSRSAAPGFLRDPGGTHPWASPYDMTSRLWRTLAAHSLSSVVSCTFPCPACHKRDFRARPGRYLTCLPNCQLACSIIKSIGVKRCDCNTLKDEEVNLAATLEVFA